MVLCALAWPVALLDPAADTEAAHDCNRPAESSANTPIAVSSDRRRPPLFPPHDLSCVSNAPCMFSVFSVFITTAL